MLFFIRCLLLLLIGISCSCHEGKVGTGGDSGAGGDSGTGEKMYSIKVFPPYFDFSKFDKLQVVYGFKQSVISGCSTDKKFRETGNKIFPIKGISFPLIVSFPTEDHSIDLVNSVRSYPKNNVVEFVFTSKNSRISSSTTTLEEIHLDSMHFFDENGNIVPPDGGEKLRGFWFKYKDAVYYDGEKIEGADPSTFSILEYGYAKDSKNFYYYKKVVKNVDLATAEVHYEGIIYLTDKNSIFLKDEQILGIDVKTAEYIGKDYFKDKNAVYYKTQKISADPETIDCIYSEKYFDLTCSPERPCEMSDKNGTWVEGKLQVPE